MTDPMHPPFLKYLSSSLCRDALVVCAKVCKSINHTYKHVLQ